jgi:predicted ATPase/class 3 adenylate cyclase/DNA-binding CsgD family transcriptional regulator
MALLPEGTITFMVTDLQGSTQTWEKLPGAMRGAMARHDAILADTVRDHAGALVEAGREGDGVLAVFKVAASAAACAVAIQNQLASEVWPDGLKLKVRVALNTGAAQLREGQYFGRALNRCARLLAICHPGQILVTQTTESILAYEMPPGIELEDLGLHRLKDLARPEHVFQLNELSSSIEFPSSGSLPQPLTNMRRYLTTFVGRSAELSALKSLLPKTPLVTLTGAGGSGKTRLAAELGQACLHLWPGGIWWVDMAPLDDSRQVPGAVAAALQLAGRGPADAAVMTWLADRRAVLILDNCEHVVAACAAFCQAALESCPDLTIIATSREPLGVPGEVCWPILAMPATDAMQLFEARAQLVVPNYKITASNLGTVTQVCDRLDGMPLAIELAAARMSMLTDQELLTQLSDRFQLLRSRDRTVSDRHKTMLATIDWSYRLLTEDEALLFRRLSVFRGGFTLEGAQAVCGDGIAAGVLDLLAGLVQKSMVMVERTNGSASRYRLMESSLAFAEERMQDVGEIELLGRRHYEYFQQCLATRTVWRIGRHWAIGSFERAEWQVQESGNLWAALGWARKNAEDLGLSLAVDFAPTDVTQAESLFADLLAHSPTRGVVRVKALCRASYIAGAQGDYESARQEAESAVVVAREVGDVDWLVFALNRFGAVQHARREFAAAADIYEEAGSLLKGSTNLGHLFGIRNSVALLAIDTGDDFGAAKILVECVAAAKAEGDVMQTAASLASLARAHLALNDQRAACDRFREALSIARRLNDGFAIVDCLDSLSCVAAVGVDDKRALRLAAAADRLSRERSVNPEPWLKSLAEAAERRSRSKLGTLKSETAWKEGWAMSLDEAIDYALADGEPEKAVDPGPLSLRELEVAKLVAAGTTNRQIAKRLFISERTAEGHIEHIRNKLGVRSRTQIATWAVQRGLAETVPQINGSR